MKICDVCGTNNHEITEIKIPIIKIGTSTLLKVTVERTDSGDKRYDHYEICANCTNKIHEFINLINTNGRMPR